MDEIESKPLTHTCEFVGMDFHMRLNTLQGFSHFAYNGLDPILKDFEQQRLQARKRDDEQMGPLEYDENYPHHGGEEIDIAYEEYPAYEANELVGCFALVHIVLSLDMYFDALLKDVNLKGGRKAHKKKAKKNDKPDEGQKIVAAIRAIEAGIRKKVPAGTVDLIKEIIAARNDFIHNRGHAKTAKRFMIKHEYFPTSIRFTKDEVEESITKLHALVEFLGEECKPISQEWAKKWSLRGAVPEIKDNNEVTEVSREGVQ